jgi:hypothetical protein
MGNGRVYTQRKGKETAVEQFDKYLKIPFLYVSSPYDTVLAVSES